MRGGPRTRPDWSKTPRVTRRQTLSRFDLFGCVARVGRELRLVLPLGCPSTSLEQIHNAGKGI